MTRYDQRIMFTALAFITVLLKDGEKLDEGSAQRIMKFANLLGDFCTEKVPPVVQKQQLANDGDATELDFIINHHVRELRQKHETHLPEDRETLLKLYDRLQVRKFRRMQGEYFAQATAEQLADKVLNYLDEEIEDAERLS